MRHSLYNFACPGAYSQASGLSLYKKLLSLSSLFSAYLKRSFSLSSLSPRYLFLSPPYSARTSSSLLLSLSISLSTRHLLSFSVYSLSTCHYEFAATCIKNTHVSSFLKNYIILYGKSFLLNKNKIKSKRFNKVL